MKKLIFIALLAMSIPILSVAQNLNSAEYFFDSDPGQGNGTAITVNPGDSVTIQNLSIPTTALSAGFHNLFIRVHQNNRQWSQVRSNPFYLKASTGEQTAILNKAEYFFDTDPGQGNGTAITLNPGDSVTIQNLNIPTTALSAGFHNLFVRVHQSNGQWSQVRSNPFYLKASTGGQTATLNNAEYYFDSDPGQGNGTAISVTPGDTVSIPNLSIPTTALSAGFHNLFIRVHQSNGQWSQVRSNPFYLNNSIPLSGNITAAEYYFDNAVAPGSGSPVAIPNPGDTLSLNNVPMAFGSLPPGQHTVFFRLRNDMGQWGMPKSDTFSLVAVSYVNKNATGANNGNSWVNAYTELGTAIKNYNSGEVWVAAGNYKPLYDDQGNTPADPRNKTFLLKPNMPLFGGFNGSEGNRFSRDWKANPTIMDGDLNGNDDPSLPLNQLLTHSTRSDNSNHVLNGETTNPNGAMIDGFIVRNGNANQGAGGASAAGGISIKSNAGNPVAVQIKNCIFQRNASTRGGVGLVSCDGNAASNANVNFDNCAFSGNSGGYDPAFSNDYTSGIVINTSGGTSGATFTNCTASGNDAERQGFFRMAAPSGAVSLTLKNFIDYANVNGGIFNGGGSTTISVSYSDMQGGYAGANNINVDPQFIDGNGPDNLYGTGDDIFILKTASPCKDAGNPTGAYPSYDLAHSPRINNNIIDIGAYEYLSPEVTCYKDQDNDAYGNSAFLQYFANSCGVGYAADNTDCNDGNAAIHPGATETCNGLDDNCNGTIDEGLLITFYGDSDGDGFGLNSNATLACSLPLGYATNNTDCNDANASIHPGVAELCNGVDDNCNGNIDEGLLLSSYPDSDGDGYGFGNNPTQSCSIPQGYVSNNTDCNDNNGAVNPGATEICNSIDDNCNGQIDEVLSSCVTPLNPAHSNVLAYSATLGWSAVVCATEYRIQYRVFGATNYTNGPIVAVPNVTVTLSGLMASTHYQWRVRAICYNGSSTINTSPLDFTTLPTPVPWYQDADNDGFGNPAVTTTASLQPAGYVANNTDCNDAPGLIGPYIYPGAPERCDNLDNNCNGQIDEGVGGGTCPIPAGLATSEITYHSARVRWTRTECVASYVVQYRIVGGSYMNGPTISFPDTTAVLNGLMESTNYQWRVRSICFNGASSQSSQPQPFTTPSSTPTWYADADGDGYGNPGSTIVASVQPTGYVSGSTDCNDAIASIHPGAQEYCNGIDDDCDNLIDEVAIDCPTPTGQSVTNITATKAKLNWSAAACATTYNVQYRVRGTDTWSSRNVTTLFLQLSNLTTATQYEWRVRAKCGLYFSPFTSPLVRFTTLAALASSNNGSIAETSKVAQKSTLFSIKNRFSLSPNPTTGLIQLNATDLQPGTAQIKVFDQLGSALTVQPVPVINGQISQTLDLSYFAKGLYFIQLTNDAEVWVEKVMVL